MEPQVSMEVLLKQLGIVVCPDSEQELREHADYLEKRVGQLLMQNEKQEETIYRQELRITELCKVAQLLQENIKRLEALVAEKNKRVGELQEQAQGLERNFKSLEQIERHSLAECLSVLRSYPASQNDKIHTLQLFFYKVFKTISPSERAELEGLGLRDPSPAVQVQGPIYEINRNEKVTIGTAN